jgi:hypothetical protein
MHDALTVGILVFAILLGILLNQRGLERLEARVDGRFNGLIARLDRMQGELSGRLHRMQADIDHLKKNRTA